MYVEQCDICQRNKFEATKPAGVLQPLPIPEKILEDWTMDFIEGLPLAGGVNVIMVVVDRLSKYVYFITLKHPFSAKQVAKVFIDRVIGKHGIPKSIVSDRDKVFLSNFWKELFAKMGTILKRKFRHFGIRASITEQKMVHTRIEERLDQMDHEISTMKKEISKLPTMESSLNEISKNLLILMETIADKTTESAHKSATDKGKEKEASTSKSTEITRNAEEERVDGKADNDEPATDRSKFKKVEMPVFSGEDPDSWLFRAERYFQIHKLTESEKMLVSTISFDGPALNWYRSQEERDKFLS
ncbi:uncharacterized protein LOC127149990 [Cucumis melo]|uniref:Uncharacterized protein LOC127149990 n=1 Tax=Cucumis melo TaxID=3656 RepID=A0ABM3KXN8_CUCME|nr:uncharacterized protein LOC127149990 [Cucumis melo]